MAGSDISSSIVTDIEACVAQCGSLPDCKAWTFRPTDNQCWVKNAVPAETPYTASALWSGACSEYRIGVVCLFDTVSAFTKKSKY